LQGIVSSPPFLDARSDTTISGRSKPGGPCADRLHTIQAGTRYGASPGNIAALPPGDLQAVVTSPPYAKTSVDRYSDSAKRAREESGRDPESASWSHKAYGTTPGNIGNLKSGELDAVCTSPPWEDFHSNILPRAEDGHDAGAVATFNRTGKWPERRPLGMDYGKAHGQVGNQSGDSYWKSMAIVYAQCLEAIRAGGVMAVVIKRYVKDKQIVPLPDQTLELLQHVGFEPVERVKAMLVKEHTTSGLFGQITNRTERKSFFRRLAENRGSPRIDWEDVLFVRKPEAGP